MSHCRMRLSPSLLASRRLDVVRQPRETFEDTLAGCRAARYDIPSVILQLPQLKTLLDFLWRHCSGDILLVGKHKQQRLLHFPIEYDAMQLLSRLIYAVAVVAVDNENKALGSCENAWSALACETGPALISKWAQA